MSVHTSRKTTTLFGLGAVGVVLAFLAIVLLGALVSGFFIMLALGILHSVVPAIPALGFWTSFAIGIALNLLRAAVFGSAASK